MASALLSMTLFFSSGKDIENELVKSIPMDVKLSNTNVVGNLGSEIHATANAMTIKDQVYADYYRQFVSLIKETTDGVDDITCNYNLDVNITADPITDDSEYSGQMPQFDMFGAQDPSYFDNHYIKVTAGNIDRLWTEENAIAVDPAIPIYYSSVSEPTYYHLGDTIYVDNESCGEADYEFTVVAEFESRKLFAIGDYDEQYSYGIITANSTILDLMDLHPSLYGSITYTPGERWNRHSRIFNVVFTALDLEGYSKAKDTMKTIVRDMTWQYSKLNPEDSAGFTIIESDFFKILSSVTRIKGTYQMIFIAVFAMLLFLFYSMLSYSLHKREKEIFIYHSLGEKKGKIRTHYGLMYLIPSLLAGLLGILPGLLLSRLINTQILNSSKTLQAEFLRYSNNGALIENVKTPISLSFPSFSSVLLLSLLTLVIIALLVFLFSTIITSTILRKDRIKLLRGGN